MEVYVALKLRVKNIGTQTGNFTWVFHYLLFLQPHRLIKCLFNILEKPKPRAINKILNHERSKLKACSSKFLEEIWLFSIFA